MENGWYGLFKNGELREVKYFKYVPTIFDFKVAFSSEEEYDIREVRITW